jgi:hypothetical protein
VSECRGYSMLRLMPGYHFYKQSGGSMTDRQYNMRFVEENEEDDACMQAHRWI